MWTDIVIALVGLLGGGVGVTIINRIFRRFNDRADAAKTLADVAITVGELNLKLNEDLAKLKKALAILTDTIDEILPHIQGLTPEQLKRLRDANTSAKLAI